MDVLTAPPHSTARIALPRLLLFISLPLYVLDQATKLLVLHRLGDGGVSVIPGWFDLVYLTNTGAAWGMFRNSNTAFIALSFVALFLLAVLYRQGAFAGPAARVGFGLLVPGILGNLTDRLWHAHVIDFLSFDLHIPGANPWPAFNVADSCICIAVGCLFLGSWTAAPNSKTP
jgi:signal peptidase II